jgi:anti-sigma regulatory factor (Ser/Thr protein kinase)
VCCEAVHRQSALFAASPAVTGKHVDLDPVPGSVGIARALVRATLAEFDEDRRDIALLLTSELVTNAILHARTPVQLGVLQDAGHLLVSVADRLPEGPALGPRPHSHDRPGGRGLALVADLAETWGTMRRPGGKSVWFVLDLAKDTSLVIS